MECLFASMITTIHTYNLFIFSSFFSYYVPSSPRQLHLYFLVIYPFIVLYTYIKSKVHK